MNWGIFGAALLFRGAYLAWVAGRVWFDLPILDAEMYDKWARHLLSGDPSSPALFPLNPGYAYLLAGLYKLGGIGPWAPAAVQAAAGAATAVLVARIAAAVGGSTAGWAGGLLYAFAASLPFHEAQRLSGAWVNLANAAALWWLVGAGCLAGHGARRPVFSGLALGVSAWFRPNALVAGAALALSGRAPAVLLGMALALAPLVIRNVLVSREFVLTTVAGGVVFYKGNFPGPGYYTVPTFTTDDPRTIAWDFRREASRRAGRALTAAESSRYWTLETFRAIREAPAAWLARMARKARALLSADEASANLDYRILTRAAPTRASPITLAVLWILGAFGAAVTWSDSRVRLVAWYVAAYAVTLVGLMVLAEYRLPLYPALAALSGIAVAQAGRFWRASAPVRLGVAGLAVAALVWLHQPAADGAVARPRGEGPVRVMLGQMHLTAGHPEAALDEWDAAERLGIPAELLHEWRARTYAAAGRGGPAAEAWAKTLAARPEHAPLWVAWDWFVASPVAGPAAEAALAGGQEAAPTHGGVPVAVARLMLGDLAQKRGARREAEALFRAALDDPRTLPWAAVRMASLAGEAGRHAAAAGWLRRYTESRPQDASGWLEMGKALAAAGRPAEALAALQKAAALDPAHPGVLEALATGRPEGRPLRRQEDPFRLF